MAAHPVLVWGDYSLRMVCTRRDSALDLESTRAGCAVTLRQRFCRSFDSDSILVHDGVGLGAARRLGSAQFSVLLLLYSTFDSAVGPAALLVCWRGCGGGIFPICCGGS